MTPAYIFDLDGTLVDTAPDLLASLNQLMTRVGRRLIHAEEMRHLVGRGARALITGDVFHHPCQIGRPLWSTRFDEDRAQAQGTRAALLSQLADSEVLVIGTHFAAPTAGYVKRQGDTFRFET